MKKLFKKGIAKRALTLMLAALVMFTTVSMNSMTADAGFFDDVKDWIDEKKEETKDFFEDVFSAWSIDKVLSNLPAGERAGAGELGAVAVGDTTLYVGETTSIVPSTNVVKSFNIGSHTVNLSAVQCSLISVEDDSVLELNRFDKTIKALKPGTTKVAVTFTAMNLDFPTAKPFVYAIEEVTVTVLKDTALVADENTVALDIRGSYDLSEAFAVTGENGANGYTTDLAFEDVNVAVAGNDVITLDGATVKPVAGSVGKQDKVVASYNGFTTEITFDVTCNHAQDARVYEVVQPNSIKEVGYIKDYCSDCGEVFLNKEIYYTVYYVLKPSIAMPGLGNDNLTPETLLGMNITSQPKENYIKAGTGTFEYTFAPYVSYVEDYTNAGYTTSPVLYNQVEGALSQQPDVSNITYSSNGYTYALGGDVNWYVIKNEKDGWHVDGYGTWTAILNDYVVTYAIGCDTASTEVQGQVYNVESGIVALEDANAAAFDAAKASLGIDLADYYFDGWYTDASYTTKLDSFDAANYVGGITVYGKFVKKTEVTLGLFGKTITYYGGVYTYAPVDYVGVPAGLTMTGLTSSVSASEVGTYATTTTGTPVFTDANGNDVTYMYKVVAINEGTLTINKAAVTITVDNASKVEGEADPVFTGTISYDGAGYWCDDKVSFVRTMVDADKENAGADVTITAVYPQNANVDFTVVEGKLEITAVQVAPVEPTPVVPEEPTPVEPTEPTPVEPTEPEVVEPTEEPTVEPTEEPTVEPTTEVENGTVNIEDEDVALAPSISEGNDTVTIEDEDVALAANLRESGNGWQYWTILLLIIAFATYSVVRSVARAKKIKALEAEKDVAYNN